MNFGSGTLSNRILLTNHASLVLEVTSNLKYLKITTLLKMHLPKKKSERRPKKSSKIEKSFEGKFIFAVIFFILFIVISRKKIEYNALN